MAIPDHLRPKRSFKANIHMLGGSLLALTALGTYAPNVNANILGMAIPIGLTAASGVAFISAVSAYVENYRARKAWENAQTTHDDKDDFQMEEASLIATGMRDAVGRLYGATLDGKPVFLPHKRKPAFEYILGGQGTGKTTTQTLISCILSALRGDRSVFINDVKKELLPQIIKIYKSLGIEVLCLNIGPGAQDTCPGVQTPVFEHAIDTFFSEDTDLHQMTSMFIREYSKIAIEEHEGDKVPFFKDNGRIAFTALLINLLLFDPENATPTRLWEIACDPTQALKCLERLRDYSGDLTNNVIRDGQKGAATLTDLHKVKPEYLPQFLNKIVQGLQIYNSSGPLAHYGRGAVARISDMRKRHMVVASMTPLSMLNDARAHTSFNAFNFYMSAKAAPTGMRMHAILDEFTALNLPSWGKEMLVLRGLGVSAEMYIQSRIALEESMGEKSAKVVFEQSDVWQMSGLSLEDAKFASEIMGNKMVRRHNANISATRFEDIGFAFQDHEEPLKTPQQLMAMPSNHQVVKVRGHRPSIMLKTPYWEIKGVVEKLADNPLEGPAPRVSPTVELAIKKQSFKLKWWKKRSVREETTSHPKKENFFRVSSFVWLYALLTLGVVTGFQLTNPDPYFYWSKSYQGCHYVSLTGQQVTKQDKYCPTVWIRQGGHSS